MDSYNDSSNSDPNMSGSYERGELPSPNTAYPRGDRFDGPKSGDAPGRASRFDHRRESDNFGSSASPSKKNNNSSTSNNDNNNNYNDNDNSNNDNNNNRGINDAGAVNSLTTKPNYGGNGSEASVDSSNNTGGRSDHGLGSSRRDKNDSSPSDSYGSEGAFGGSNRAGDSRQNKRSGDEPDNGSETFTDKVIDTAANYANKQW